MKIEVIDGANTQDTLTWKGLAHAVHECPARRAEVVCHQFARTNRVRLTEGLEVVTATNVFQVGIGNGEVRSEHGRRDLAAIGAIAHECVDQAWTLGWLDSCKSVTR